MNLFFKSIVLAIVAFALSYGFYHLSGDFLHDSFPTAWVKKTLKLNYHTITQNISLQDINSIEVRTVNSNVYINKATTVHGKIAFTTGLAYQNWNIEKIGKQLIIDIKEQKNDNNSSLTVTIPASINFAKINTVSGDVSLAQIDSENLTINTASGEINLNAVNVNNAKITTVDGDLIWNGSCKKISTNTVSGNIYITSAYLFPNFDVKTVSGDILLNFPETIKAKIDLQSVSGQVVTRNSMSSLNQSTPPEGNIRARSVSGNIQVNGK